MPRLFLPTARIINNQISITGEKAHYLASVLRCGKGDDLVVFDGEGACIKIRIIESGRREVVAEVIENIPCDLESPLDIVLLQGMLKGEKMDLVVQKTTELGVKEIVPVITDRSQLRETRKSLRWRKIAEEASRQSGRSVVPIVHEPVAFDKFFAVHASRLMPHGFIFYEEGGTSLTQASSSFKREPLTFLIAIGPEGGFTKQEVDLAKERGLVATSLGRRILRAETAAISAVALVQLLLGDMG